MEWISVLVTLFTLGTGTYLILKRRKKEQPRECGRDYPKDVVVLHQFPRGPFAPSMSAFCIKLETYLRMHQIPYQNEFAYKMGPKGKSPWIEYNGTTMGDSQLIMDFLAQEFHKSANASLSAEQKAIGRALQKMVDEHTYWLVLLERWVYHRKDTSRSLTKLPSLLVWEIGRRTKNNAHAQGVGRHAQTEVDQSLEEDLTALSDFLGEKKFLFGDEPCEYDCAIFGQICQVKWHVPDSVKAKTFLIESLPNLNGYIDRMKERFWSDWDECITKGFTKEATK